MLLNVLNKGPLVRASLVYMGGYDGNNNSVYHCFNGSIYRILCVGYKKTSKV